MMDASRRDETIAELSADHRCVAPTPTLGADLRRQASPSWPRSFIGDELWIGAASETTLAMALAGQEGRA